MLRILISGVLLLFLPLAAWGLEITSVTPAEGPPGATVTLGGGPFAEGVRLILGDREILPDTLTENRLTFTVPFLPSGEYALSLRGPGGGKSPVKTFQLVEPIPQLNSLTPTTLNACSIQQGQTVVLSGEFPPEARVLLDGAVVPAEKVEAKEIVFSVPPLKGGMHQVEVVGQGEQRSLPHALVVESTPRILAVSQGTDQVTSYEVIITGENFLYASELIVNGEPLRRAVEGGVGRSYSALQLLGGEDYVRYVDCRTMAYIRHPVTREPNNVTLRVVNPGGEQSPAYVVAIP